MRCCRRRYECIQFICLPFICARRRSTLYFFGETGRDSTQFAVWRLSGLTGFCHTYHPKSINNRHHHHRRRTLCRDVYLHGSIRSCTADNNRSPSSTTPVAIDSLSDSPDSRDAVLSSFSATTYKLYCNWRIETTYTIRPADGHCATAMDSTTTIYNFWSVRNLWKMNKTDRAYLDGFQ